jgi:hypothetical protein
MTARNETRKHLTSVVKALVIALAVTAGTSGSALAEELSFTARAQVSQGLARGSGAFMGTYEKANIPDEAASFIARVQSSQKIAPSTASSGAARWMGSSEADSFITRVQLNHLAGHQS